MKNVAPTEAEGKKGRRKNLCEQIRELEKEINIDKLYLTTKRRRDKGNNL